MPYSIEMNTVKIKYKIIGQTMTQSLRNRSSAHLNFGVQFYESQGLQTLYRTQSLLL